MVIINFIRILVNKIQVGEREGKHDGEIWGRRLQYSHDLKLG